MALNTGRIYNRPVNGQKYIHLFLIAMLCFGQFAASTHIAGHVHHLHSTGELHVMDSDAQARLEQVFIPGGNLAHLAENADTEQEADCSIYHAFSSLCGTFTSPDSAVAKWSQLGVIFPTNHAHILLAASDDHRIRAPPANS